MAITTHDAETASPGPAGHVAVLDGVRGIAIFMVLVWHYFVFSFVGEPSSFAWGLARISILAWSGVDLFFVLSGYLLGSILIRHRHAAGSYTTFWVRRLCRIVPMYVVLLALWFTLQALLAASTNPGLRWLFDHGMPWWSYLTLTQNFPMAHAGTLGANFLTPTWSLAVEAQFYLVLPMIVAAARPKLLPWVLATLICISCALRTIVTGVVPVFVLLPTHMDSLMCGVLLAALLAESGTRAWLDLHQGLMSGLLGVAAIGFVALTLWPGTFGALRFSMLAIFYSLLIAFVMTRPASFIAACLQARWLVSLGAISYTVYLFHQPANGLLHALVFGQPPRLHGIASALVTAAAAASTVGFAWMTLRWIEQPIIRIGRRYG